MALLLAIIPLILTADATPAPRLAGGFIQLSNDALKLKASDWRDVGDAMKAIGFDTVIVQGVEYVGHDGVLFPLFEKDGVDPTAELLRYAKDHGMTVFVGLRVDENWDTIRKDPAKLDKLLQDNRKVADTVWTRYGSSPAFGGFYLAQELANFGYPDGEIDAIHGYFQPLGQHCRQISGDKPVAVSPYFNPSLAAPTRFAADLRRILDGSGVTEVMLQDGVGVREIAAADIPAKVVPFYQAVAANLAPGQRLWGNVESFEHRDGKDFPVTDFDRFAAQRRAVGPLVDRLVTWEFFHYLNPLGHTVSDPAHRAAEKALYEAYQHEAGSPPGPMSLFDGKTLAGWRKLDTVKAGEVKVEGESIVLAAGGPMTAIVTTRADLPRIDYELSFEARRTAGSDFFAAATFPVGPDFLTLVTGGWGGSVTGLSSLNGSDASENETNTFVKYENGRWYRFRLRVTAAAIRCLIDDQEVFALRLDGQQLKTRIETRICQPLGFAAWRSGSEIRAVAVRPLSPAEVEAVGQVPEPK